MLDAYPRPWYAYAVKRHPMAASHEIQIRDAGHNVLCVSAKYGEHAGAPMLESDKAAIANLIAAAPDLLAALERFAKAMEQKSYPELQGVGCDAFAAIAKARGSSAWAPDLLTPRGEK